MEDKDNIYVGGILRYKRIENDLTISELGRFLDVSPEFLSEIEIGNKVPSDFLIYNLAKLYNISHDLLFNGFNKTPILGDYYFKVKNREAFKKLIFQVNISKIDEDSRQLLYDNIFEAYLRREALSFK